MVVIYQGQTMPLKTQQDNRTEIINEFLMLMICYNLFLYTDWIGKKEEQYEHGWNHIYIICAMIAYNSLSVLAGIKKNFKLNCIKYSRIIYNKFAKKASGNTVKDS